MPPVPAVPVDITLKLPVTVKPVVAMTTLPVWFSQFQVRLAKDCPKPPLGTPVPPVTKQVEPAAHVNVGIAVVTSC